MPGNYDAPALPVALPSHWGLDTLPVGPGPPGFPTRVTLRNVIFSLTPYHCTTELDAAAAAAGAGLSQYVRELCLRRSATPSTVGGARRNPEAKRLLNELNWIGNNLNQLARVANTLRAAPQHEELKAAIEVLKATLAHVLSL